MDTTMQDAINRQKKYDGTQAWNDAGFRGQGIVVWNMENMTDHGETTTRRISDNALDVKIYTLSNNMTFNNDVISSSKIKVDGKIFTAEEFVKEYNVKVCTRSVGGGTGIGKADSIYFNKIKNENNVVFFGAGGNDGEEGAGSSLPPDVAIWVGACTLTKTGKPIMAGYSGVGREGKYDIDFSDFVGVWSGTSFASPALAGKCALIKSRYNIDMSQDEVYKYFMFCVEDIDTTTYPDENGSTYDVKSGYGIVIMPDPKRKYVTMTIGSKDYFVDGVKKTMDTTPILKDNRTFVPLRAISESLGATVDWAFNENKKIRVNIKYKGDEIILNENEKTIYKNGVATQLDVAPFVNTDARTMVPLRGIVEILNGQINWIEAEQKVMFLEG